MFGISFPEFLIILLVMFLVLGPERMAASAYDVGRWVAKAKELITHIRQTHLKDIDTSTFYDAKIELNKSLNDLKCPPTVEGISKPKIQSTEPHGS